MGKTLYYYQAFITYNNQVTNIHLSDLFDAILRLEDRQRLKRLKQGNISLMGVMDPYTNSNDYSDRKLVLGKFRENKPFLGNLGTDRIDEIPDDVLELTSIFYRNNSRLLIIEYNHHGLRPGGLQNYLNSFLPVTEDGRWSAVLEPIEPDLGFDDVAQSRDIKNIEFKIDLTARDRRIYHAQHEENNHRSVLGNILTESIETHQEFGANYATVGFSNGKLWRRNVIDPEQLVTTLRALDLESDIFESIKVHYVSPTTGKKENLNLKNQGVLKGFLDIDEDGWEYICNHIENLFYNNGRVGENNYLEYEIEAYTDLPDLVYTDFE